MTCAAASSSGKSCIHLSHLSHPIFPIFHRHCPPNFTSSNVLIHYRVMINASINAAPSAEAEPAEASTGGDPPCQVNGSSHPSSASPAFRDAHCDEEQELQRKLALCDEERELEQKLTLLERRIRAHRELIITQAFGPLAGQFDLPIAPMETDIHLSLIHI